MKGGGEDATSSGASSFPADGWTELRVSPAAVAKMLLTSPLRSGANFVALDATPEACFVVVKRGSRTIGAFRTDVETGMAAAILIARAVDVDPIALGSEGTRDGVCRRLHVRADTDIGELLVCLSEGLAGPKIEVRPLVVNERSSVVPGRPQLGRCVSCGALQRPELPSCEIDGGRILELADKAEPGGFIGPYKLGGELGRGGMGVVYSGEHAFLRRPVAVKLLQWTLGEDPLSGRRFLSEARAASRLTHPGIVEIFDYGLLDDGSPYMVMERLFGESLQARLDRLNTLAPVAALLLTREIARSLEAAHRGGVVHLDLKPSNVVLLEPFDEAAPRIKLIDFGAAAVAGAPSEVGALVGTPHYMSPEHARGEPADGRSDIYSLGIMLFEMLSGTVPFDHANPWRVLKAHLVDPVPAVSSPGELLPQAVSRLVARALRKRREERHQTASELLGDLDSALAVVRRKEWLRWLP